MKPFEAPQRSVKKENQVHFLSSFGIGKGRVKYGLTQFRAILSAIGTPTYKLIKFLVPILSDVTENEFTVQDSFTFVDEILTQDIDLDMDSLDADSLFTN